MCAIKRQAVRISIETTNNFYWIWNKKEYEDGNCITVLFLHELKLILINNKNKSQKL